MIDIEQTKKLNFMIKELTRTGAASSFDDAVAMAGNVYEEGLPETTASVVLAKEGDRVRQLIDERIRHHLANASEGLNNELKRVSESHESLKSELKQLWQAVEGIKQQAPKHIKPEEIDSTKDTVIPMPQPEVVQHPRGFTSPMEQPRPALVDHPRSGSYKSDDVALDKFFYFGNKR
ncbi:MAG: hypothetical protein V1837_05265 [Candidatus Woesearchaeota archaeon]